MTNPQTLTHILRYVDSFQLETQTLPTAAMIAEAVPVSDIGESLKQLVTDGFLLDYPANLIYAISYSGRYLLQLKTDPSALDPAKIKAAQDSNEYAMSLMHPEIKNPYIYGRFRADVYRGFNIIVKTNPATYYSDPAVSVAPHDISPIAEIYYQDGGFMQWVSQPGDMSKSLEGAKAAIDEYLFPHEPEPSPDVIRRAIWGTYSD